MVEYEDEFGRVRTARRSEVPRDLAPSSDPVAPEDEFVHVLTSLSLFIILMCTLSQRDTVICKFP
jgi:hypothetical protein